MNIEDKLPKAEDVLREHHVSDSLFSMLNRDGFTPASQGDRIIKAMHEYARRLLDVVEESEKEILKGIADDDIESKDGWWETSTGAEFGASKLIELEERILKLKEMLK